MSTHTNRECLTFLLLLLLVPPHAAAQLQKTLPPPPHAAAQLPNTLPTPSSDSLSRLKFDKSMAIVLVILVVVFFALGFLSVYTRQCAERRMRGRFDLAAFPIVGSTRRHRGLDQEIIDTFPTFVYSTVKGLKIGRTTLECAVCLNEFQDDETLRLIPKCSHVFHLECIDAWLANHSTCPVCRANLIPNPGDVSIVAVQIPDPESDGSNRPNPGPDSNNNDNGGGVSVPTESPKVDPSVNQSRPIRSRSTGFRIGNFFPRSHSTGHSLVQPGESLERFTLRLQEEVRTRLVSLTPTSAASHGGAAFARESSVRRGYRTRSVGAGRSFLQYEQFGRADRRGFNWTPPFLSRAGSTRSPRESAEGNKEAVDPGERSSDRLFAGGES